VALVAFAPLRSVAAGADVATTWEETCASCHGADLTGGQAPSLLDDEWGFGGDDASLAESIRDGRADSGMPAFGEALSDQDIEDLAAYFSAQTARGGETEPSKLSTGQHVYRGGNLERQVAACAGCHGPAGQGNPAANYPSIKGQHSTYVAAQLRAYRSGARATDPNQMMRNVAAGLTDEEIDAVASYVQGLR
jgi:cbb3-type cytochrome c oxidase subunit III